MPLHHTAFFPTDSRAIWTWLLTSDTTYTILTELVDYRMITGKRRVQSPHALPPSKKRSTTITQPLEHRHQKPAVSQYRGIVRGETLLFALGTPICYNFHSCDAVLIRKAIRVIRTEDLPMNLNLKTTTFSLPKYLDDNGLAVSWLVSLSTCLAWCFHNSSVPAIIITEPELDIEEPYITVNEKELPSLRVDLHPGSMSRRTSAELSTTATELVCSFLDFTHNLPMDEMDTEEQVIFALADFLHDRPDKCKSCVLWRAAWKECLERIYGKDVARSMVREREFQPMRR